ncbi:Tctn1 [Scenedesmus sp. PABB004]|nr:Tctn1 [Scenedesmus sp. PABB004]
MSRALLSALLACASLAAAAVGGARGENSFATFPVDWARVPAAGAEPATAANLTATCTCALLNAGACTPNCCCDPACPAPLVAGFRAAGACLPEGPPPEQLTYCTPDEPFARVNLPSGDFYRIAKAPAGADFFTQLLCVAADHNPSLGAAYPDPPAGDVGANAAAAACPAPPAAAPVAAGYEYGQPLLASAPAGGGRATGALVLPSGALSAECLDAQQVGFMARLPASLCGADAPCERTFRSAAELAALCGDADSPLSPAWFVGLSFPAHPAASSFRPVTLTSLSRADPATGALTALDPAADLAAPTPAAGPPAACRGVVVAAHFLFRYTLGVGGSATGGGRGQLASAGVSLVLGDAVLPPGGAPLVLTTRFSVSWANASAPDADLPPLSGLPGYRPGFPVLAGVLAAGPGGAAAVSRLRGGLQLPGAGDAGRCSASVADVVGLGFGYNATTTCAVGLTLPQLRAFCTADDPGKTLRDLLGGWLDDLTSQQARASPPGGTPRRESCAAPPLAAAHAARRCRRRPCHRRGVVTGFDLRLLTGVAFASGNLQAKLLYATACFARGEWRFNTMAGGALQLFRLRFAAAFVPADQPAPVASLRPAPPLAAPLPPDLFYPFLTTSSTSAAPHRRRARGAGLLAAGAAAALLLAAVL